MGRTGETLCLACGMCCDGSLFDNVRLAQGESVKTFKGMGLPVKLSRAKEPVAFVRQPCPALCENLECQVYKERPLQCRSFECQVYKDLIADDLSLEAALRVVKQGRRKAERIRKLLRKMGECDEGLSIGKRFKRIQRRLESGRMDEDDGEAFAELGLAMHQFDLFAHKRFYTTEDSE